MCPVREDTTTIAANRTVGTGPDTDPGSRPRPGQQMTQPGGSATVQASLCAGASFALCLVPGAYPAVAVNQFGQASNTMTVTSSGCSNPITLASNSGAQTKSKSSGALAFTGSNV